MTFKIVVMPMTAILFRVKESYDYPSIIAVAMANISEQVKCIHQDL